MHMRRQRKCTTSSAGHVVYPARLAAAVRTHLRCGCVRAADGCRVPVVAMFGCDEWVARGWWSAMDLGWWYGRFDL